MSQEGGDNCEYQLVVGCTHEALDRCVRCKKNDKHQTHEDFIPFNNFKLENLPEECRSKHADLDVIRWLAFFTVQLDVNYISIHRPLDGFGVDPNLRGKRAIIKGSGSVIAVIDKTLTTRKTQCPRECSAPDGDQFCGYFVVATAAHVVFDDEEAANTSVVFFFHDSQKRNLIEKCHGVNVQTTSKEGDFTEMLCVTHNRQFFDDLRKHVENRINTSISIMTKEKKGLQTREGATTLKDLTNYFRETMTLKSRCPNDLAFPSEFPTGVWHKTCDCNLYCFTRYWTEEFKRIACEIIGLDQCEVISSDGGMKVKGNILGFQSVRKIETSEMFLLCFSDRFLVMCTKPYLLYIMLASVEAYVYKGTFEAQSDDDGSLLLCRKTDCFPPPHMKELLHLYGYERSSLSWLRLSVEYPSQTSSVGKTDEITERLIREKREKLIEERGVREKVLKEMLIGDRLSTDTDEREIYVALISDMTFDRMIKTLKDCIDIWSELNPEKMIDEMLEYLHYYQPWLSLLKPDSGEEKKCLENCKRLLSEMRPKTLIGKR